MGDVGRPMKEEDRDYSSQMADGRGLVRNRVVEKTFCLRQSWNTGI